VIVLTVKDEEIFSADVPGARIRRLPSGAEAEAALAPRLISTALCGLYASLFIRN
jgi:hypothetical protein